MEERSSLSLGGLRSGREDLAGLGFDRGSTVLSYISLGMLSSHRGLLHLLL